MTERNRTIYERIRACKEQLGEQVLILAHHYQQESVYQFADLTGDSLKLARQAAQAGPIPFIIFCGVHFMAESADILTGEEQAVLLPDLHAGCPMADMASIDGVERAWEELGTVCDMSRTVPITYVNSSAQIKSFVGRRGGSVCTSSNAERVLRWALSQGERVFFFPDEHLGRNSSRALGIGEEEIALWRRGSQLGGCTRERLLRAKTILWNGYCHVHQEFSVGQIETMRTKHAGIRIMVHPESPYDVVRAADHYGSTEGIIKAVEESSPGSIWAIGTEVHLVERLQRQHPDKRVLLLAPTSCSCATMNRIMPERLLDVLEPLTAGRVMNRITVERSIALGAKLALDRMLEI